MPGMPGPVVRRKGGVGCPGNGSFHNIFLFFFRGGVGEAVRG
jgi:hypothetical protein